MNAPRFVTGLALGFSIAAPVGPIGVLCITRSLRGGMRVGWISGLGAASADAVYGCVAAFGLAAVSRFLVAHQQVLGLLGGCGLCWLGIAAFRSRPVEAGAPAPPMRLARAYGTTLALTLANPATILSFVAAFAALGLGGNSSYLSATEMVIGVFMGSALWWLILSFISATLRRRVGPAFVTGLNRLSGGVLIAFGLYALVRASALWG